MFPISLRRAAIAAAATMLCISCVRGDAAETKSPAEALRSPWDLHPVALADTRYSCPHLAALPRNIVAYDYYSDSKHSITDPKRKAAYEAAARPFTEVEDAAERAADEFQHKGSRQAAACAAQIIVQQAQADAMTGSMSSNQAYYVQNWTLGALAIVWLKVRPAGDTALSLTSEQEASLQKWMKRTGQQVEGYFESMHDKGAGSGRNNHLYWAGLAVMSAGIAADDRKLYEWGAGTYKIGVDQIQPDGTLPLEMGRGQRALHYHLFALAPLVTMAELASANGEDLYAYDNSRIHLLVARTLAGLIDNRYFVAKTGVAQDTPDKGDIKSYDISWLPPYARRFPDPGLTALLNRVPIRPDSYIGGMPPP